ncbi:MAG TPA: dicarboxylate/amino acid:cation symporter [Cyanobacteria bacterium UBA8156]|nr:dicarboxylate/amino acid:cation symporter [Cyanobacteria bacterium UBA8156]
MTAIVQWSGSNWGQTVVAVLKSPWTVLASIGLGVYLGIGHPQAATGFAMVGQLYLSLLRMCVLPILLSAIVMSIGRLVGSSDASQALRRITGAFLVGMILAALVGMVVALVLGPGRSLDRATLQKLGVLVNASGIDLEFALNQPTPPPPAPPSLTSFLTRLIPDNIFSSLTNGDTLQVLFFCIVFGLTLGAVKSRQATTADAVFDLLEVLYKSFNQLIGWLTLALPIALCSLLAAQIAKAGIDLVLTMVNFLLCTIAVYAFLYGVSTLVIWRRARCTLPATLQVVSGPTVLALATANALACLPAAIGAMTELRFVRQTTDLVIPLGVTLGRFGQIAYFALATVFVAQLYQMSLGLGQLAMVGVGSILAGLASSGATGLVTLSTLGVVLQPLGLPLEAVLALFVAIDALVDPMRTLCTLHGGMAATAAVAERDLPPQNLAERVEALGMVALAAPWEADDLVCTVDRLLAARDSKVVLVACQQVFESGAIADLLQSQGIAVERAIGVESLRAKLREMPPGLIVATADLVETCASVMTLASSHQFLILLP